MKKHGSFTAGVLSLLAALWLAGCSTETAIEGILGSSGLPPVFLECRALAAGEVSFRFSTPVKVLGLNFDPLLEPVSVEEGSLVTVAFTGDPAPGEKVTADILVEDEKGNTLNVLVPFRTRNDRLPPVMLTELRTEYQKPKAEFLEFRSLAPGNLGALRVFIAGTAKEPVVFEFSPVEVAEGEYILLHLRTAEGAVNETGSNLDLSGGGDAVAGIRDIWVPGTDKLLHKTDAVYFLDQDDTILDAVLLSQDEDPQWKNERLVRAAEMLAARGAWKGADNTVPGPKDAVITAGIGHAMTRSVSRYRAHQDTDTAGDWYIAGTGEISPGKPNSR
jgi:hypothetical protein